MRVEPTLLLLLPLAASGCALQVTGGAARSGESDLSKTATVAMTMHALRGNNGIAGVRAGTAIDDGLVLKHGVLHGGYDWHAVPGWVTLEAGPDVGVGNPIVHRFDGVGAYAGVAGTARLRLLGANDAETAFHVAAPVLELVLAPRGGAWMPPEGSNTRTLYGEWALEAGLRVAIGSDLFSTSQGRVGEADGRSTRPDGGKP